jgi:hypothetical protein
MVTVLLACAPSETVVVVELLFPQNQEPLRDSDTLRVTVHPGPGSLEVLRQELRRPSDGPWQGVQADLPVEMNLPEAQVRLEGLGHDGQSLCYGASQLVPLMVGRPGRVRVFMQRWGTAGLGPALPEPSGAPQAVLLAGGGVFLAPAGEAAGQAWVYDVNTYDVVPLANLPEPQSGAVMAALNERQLLFLGNDASGAEAWAYDTTLDAWTVIGLPGVSARPVETHPRAVTSLPGGGALAVLGRELWLFAADSQVAPELLLDLPLEVQVESLSACGADRVVALGNGDRFAWAFDLAQSAVVEVAQPTEGRRVGHGVVCVDSQWLVVAGGAGATGEALAAEAYSPSADAWHILTAVPVEVRRGASLTSLPDGRVLWAGGGANGPLGEVVPLATALVFPVTGDGVATIELTRARAFHGAVALASGTVLLAGGLGPEGQVESSAELLLPPRPEAS